MWGSDTLKKTDMKCEDAIFEKKREKWQKKIHVVTTLSAKTSW